MATKKGFTLSEVMIAVTVVGVLAAILVPTVMKTMPSNSKVLFKKAYSTLEKSVNNMISDDTNYPSDQSIIPNNGTTSYSKGFNYTTATTNTSNKFCYFLTDQLNISGSSSCPATGSTGLGLFTTNDGILWNVYIPVSDTTTNSETVATVWTTAVQFPVGATVANSYTTKVIVDVNGPSTGPNCTNDDNAATYNFNNGTATAALTKCPNWKAYASYTATEDPCAKDKPDRFIFGVRYDGRLQIGSAGGTDACADRTLTRPTTNQNY